MKKKHLVLVFIIIVLSLILLFSFKSNKRVDEKIQTGKVLVDGKDICVLEKKKYYTINDRDNDIDIYFICLSEVYVNNSKKEPLYKYFKENSFDDFLRYLNNDLIIYSSYNDGNVVVRKGINMTIVTCNSSDRLEKVLIGTEDIDVDGNICN